MRNEVWGWDLDAIVKREIDDELAQDLVIRVRHSLEPHAYEKKTLTISFSCSTWNQMTD